ncbi:hypothetical protein [Nocardioides nanhaiensis]|uniref:Uncharacterized protein n=1 Tax=Nocardioides nanhaiensis TaxID=1476871 RepID=A0ABP8VQL1_9ACTN
MSRRRLLLGGVLVLVVVMVAGALWWWTQRESAAPVDERLAGRIEATGLQPYRIDLEGAEPVSVQVRRRMLEVRYERDDVHVFLLLVQRAPQGDLCPRGEGEQPDGGTCTSDGDTLLTSFEEMGSASLRRDGVLLTVGALVIESDAGLQQRALDALAGADPISAEELSRLRH